MRLGKTFRGGIFIGPINISFLFLKLSVCYNFKSGDLSGCSGLEEICKKAIWLGMTLSYEGLIKILLLIIKFMKEQYEPMNIVLQ